MDAIVLLTLQTSISMSESLKYAISLTIEAIRLPPFQDILILGKNAAQGKLGLSRSLELLTPNEFESVGINEECVEAVFISKRILKKITKERVLSVLRENVFKLVAEGELIKVEFKLLMSYNPIEIEM
ncbi:MAG: hypothetical protein J0I41_11070 [Filimonas sp.]|nr:hypothetical protein [Filimonas sp.]